MAAIATSPLSNLPLAVALDRNKFLGRAAIESLGYDPLLVATSRNKYERIENVLDWAFWVVLGIVVPYVMDRAVSRRYSDHLRRQFNLPVPAVGDDRAKTSLLNLPLEWAEHSGRLVRDTTGQVLPAARQQLVDLAGQLKFDHPDQLLHLLENPAFRQKLQVGKVGMMWLGLEMMATKGQLFSWSKNWLTEKFSGKRGFSGEFTYTTDAYREQKSSWFTKTQKTRQKVSVGLGFAGATLFPLAVMGALKNWPGFGKLVGALPRFNYTDAIFMPKEVFFVHTLFNYNLPTLLSCRDPHELREKFTKCAAFDFFYYLGDDLIAGQVARFLEKSRGLTQPLTKMRRSFIGLKFPHAIPLEKVYSSLARAHPGESVTENPIYQAAKTAYWSGFLGTSFGLGLTVPICNNLYTHHQVMKEQKQAMPSLVSPPAVIPQVKEPGVVTGLVTDQRLVQSPPALPRGPSPAPVAGSQPSVSLVRTSQNGIVLDSVPRPAPTPSAGVRTVVSSPLQAPVPVTGPATAPLADPHV